MFKKELQAFEAKLHALTSIGLWAMYAKPSFFPRASFIMASNASNLQGSYKNTIVAAMHKEHNAF